MKPLKLKQIDCPLCQQTHGVHKESARRALTSKQMAKYRKAQKAHPQKTRFQHVQVGRQRSLEELLTNAEIIAALQVNTSGVVTRPWVSELLKERLLKICIVLLSGFFFYLYYYHDMPSHSAKAMFLVVGIIALWISGKLDGFGWKRWYKRQQTAYEILRKQWFCLRCFHEWEKKS